MKLRQLVLDRMRFLNKRVFNRLTLKFAGSSHSPISVIRHIGRRTGRTYETPVLMQPSGHHFVFALPYGRDVDWYRNVLAARRGTVIWHGKEYAVENPAPLVVRSTSSQTFPLALRLIVRMLGPEHFMQMKSSKVRD